MSNEWMEAEGRYERARHLFESQRWDEALTELSAAIEMNPGNSTWHGSLGYILDQLQRYGEAIQAYRAALEIDPADREALIGLAVDLARVHRYREALQTLERVAAEHPDYEPAYCHRIYVYAQLGQHDQAEAMFYLAQQLDDRCPHCFLHMGGSLLARGAFGRAIYCLERALSLCPGLPDARRQIAAAYRAQGKLSKAKQYYLAELRSQVEDLEVLADLAEACVESGDPRAAGDRYRLLAELDPKRTDAWVALGRLALENGASSEALKYLRKAASCDPDFPGLQLLLGELCLRQGRLEAAARHLGLALRHDPDDVRVLMAMGNCLLEQRRTDLAAEHFRRLVELTPDLPGPYHNLAVCCYLRGRYEEGIALCLRALELKGDYVMAMEKLAIGYLHIGRLSDARHWTRRARTLEPQSAALKRLQRRCRRALLARTGRAGLACLRRLWTECLAAAGRRTPGPAGGAGPRGI